MDLGWFEAALNVTDIKRSLEFYQTLGFEIGNDGEINNNVAALHKDDCSLTLYQGHLNPARPQLIFWQGDVSAICADLTTKGLKFFRGPNSDDAGTAAMLIDPDGHPIFFITMKKYDGNSPATGPDGRRVKARQYPPNAKRDIALGWFELSLPVADVAVSRDLYTKLGFQFVETNDAGKSVTLENRDCRLTLFQDVLDPPRVQLIFYQGDIDAIERELTSRGLDFQWRPNDGKRQGAMLIDPDGHPIYFVNVPGDTRKAPV